MGLFMLTVDIARLVWAAWMESLDEWLTCVVASCKARSDEQGFQGPTGLVGRVWCILAGFLWRRMPKEMMPIRLREVVGTVDNPCGCEKE